MNDADDDSYRHSTCGKCEYEWEWKVRPGSDAEARAANDRQANYCRRCEHVNGQAAVQ